jgi:hypothetical protein
MKTSQGDAPMTARGGSWSLTLNGAASTWTNERAVDDVARRVPVCSMSPTIRSGDDRRFARTITREEPDVGARRYLNQ